MVWPHLASHPSPPHTLCSNSTVTPNRILFSLTSVLLLGTTLPIFLWQTPAFPLPAQPFPSLQSPPRPILLLIRGWGRLGAGSVLWILGYISKDEEVPKESYSKSYHCVYHLVTNQISYLGALQKCKTWSKDLSALSPIHSMMSWHNPQTGRAMYLSATQSTSKRYVYLGKL